MTTKTYDDLVERLRRERERPALAPGCTIHGKYTGIDGKEIEIGPQIIEPKKRGRPKGSKTKRK